MEKVTARQRALLEIEDYLINFDDPASLVKDEYKEIFGRKELAPYLRSSRTAELVN